MRLKASGRPRTEFTPEMIDGAKRSLGRHVYPSHAADELRRAHKIGRDASYRLMDKARAEVVETLAGDGVDPLTGVYLFLQSVVADITVPIRDRLAAAGGIIKLLGLHRLTNNPEVGDVGKYLAGIVAAQIAREGSTGESNSMTADL